MDSLAYFVLLTHIDLEQVHLLLQDVFFVCDDSGILQRANLHLCLDA